jgi:hypothetical protein
MNQLLRWLLKMVTAVSLHGSRSRRGCSSNGRARRQRRLRLASLAANSTTNPSICATTTTGSALIRSARHCTQHIGKHLRIAVRPSERHSLTLVFHSPILKPDLFFNHKLITLPCQLSIN